VRLVQGQMGVSWQITPIALRKRSTSDPLPQARVRCDDADDKDRHRGNEAARRVEAPSSTRADRSIEVVRGRAHATYHALQRRGGAARLQSRVSWPPSRAWVAGLHATPRRSDADSGVARKRERMLGVWKLEAFEVEFRTLASASPLWVHPNGTSSSPPKGADGVTDRWGRRRHTPTRSVDAFARCTLTRARTG